MLTKIAKILVEDTSLKIRFKKFKLFSPISPEPNAC